MGRGFKPVNIKITTKPHKDTYLECKVYDETKKWVVSKEFIVALVAELDRQNDKDIDYCVTRGIRPNEEVTEDDFKI